jgi:tetratricopeptide (TPR) repeat protein
VSVLRRLAERRALRPAEQARLVALLEARARAWRAEDRPRPELAVRRELAVLAASSAEAGMEVQQDTAARAARSWWRLGAHEKAREIAASAGIKVELAPETEHETKAGGGESSLSHHRCHPGADDPCAVAPFSLPARWFASEDIAPDPATAEADASLLTGATLTASFRLGGLAFVRRMAHHREIDLIVETLREEDDTSAFNWETIALLELLRGRTTGAERAFAEAVTFHPSRADGWARVAEAWEAAGQLPQACVAWKRAAAVYDDAWDPRWQHLLRCIQAAPQVGDARAWTAFLQSKVPDSARAEYARWLGASDPRDDQTSNGD